MKINTLNINLKSNKMDNSQLWMVVNTTNEFNEHTTGLSEEEAYLLEQELTDMFPNEYFEIHPDMSKPSVGEQYRTIPRGLADGYEDLYDY